VATWVDSVRAEGHPVLLLDAGDTIQGSALAYYHHRRNPVPPEPMMKIMGHMSYDAMTVGNHEFNFGLKPIDKSTREAPFPWLSANIISSENGTPFFEPYVIKELEGIRVGILGLTTPNIPNWETPEHYAGLGFLDTVETARRYVPLLREKEKVDAVVVLTHQALERDLETRRSNETEHENQVFRLITEVPGIDVVLMGHTHRAVEPQEVEGVVICEPRAWGRTLCRIDLFFEKDQNGDIHLSRWSGELLEAKEVESHQQVLDVARDYHEQTMAYINSVIGNAVVDVPAENARFRDTPMMDLLQNVMLAESGADLSMAALLPRSFEGLPAGPITVQQILSFYVYDNTMVVLEVTGKDVKEALEHAARYYGETSFHPEGKLEITRNPHMPGYNFDILAGAAYRIDPTQPVGERICDLTYQGRPMELDRVYKLVTTNYRAAGGGNFHMLKDAKVLWRSSEEIRNLLIEHIRRQGTIVPYCDYNWVVAPDVVPVSPVHTNRNQ
jgi:2',3'-cyclic-nucleotide 2'-phosphodiesterase/3'-nucleotidase